MRMLIVEDETLTRSSILEAIDWERHGIRQVEEAADGMEAFAKIGDFIPDILLTDIKMPRMNGLEFANLLRRKNPKCLIIFMSGYAEKEYLKSAISLKAVSYVEKPIDLEELEDAIRNAVNLYRSEYLNALVHKQWEKASPIVIQDASLQLSRGTITEETLGRLELIGIHLSEYASCVTCMLKFNSTPPKEEELVEILEHSLEDQEHIVCLYGFKDDKHWVLHLLAKQTGSLEKENSLRIVESMSTQLRDRHYSFAASIGKVIPESARIHESYTAAVVGLQETFYQGKYSIVIHKQDASIGAGESYAFDPSKLNEFRNAILIEEFDHARHLICTLTAEVKRKPNTLINHVKEIYYRHLQEIEKAAAERGANLQSGDTPFQWDHIMNSQYLAEVESLVTRKLDQLHQAINTRGSSSMASRIIKYIHQHYMDEDLSVQEIADFFQITASYLISVFKEATGTTVRQFVIDYRIGMAKELLRTKQLKISAVAQQVGFRDGEYFAKIFRKSTGLKPSEFRERFQDV